MTDTERSELEERLKQAHAAHHLQIVEFHKGYEPIAARMETARAEFQAITVESARFWSERSPVIAELEKVIVELSRQLGIEFDAGPTIIAGT